MDTLGTFIPVDRRQALAGGATLPEHTHGAALLADLVGYTALTESLTTAYGMQRGAEEITLILNGIFDALIAQVERYGGSTISFAGDAIIAWFDDSAGPAPGVERAATCALALQRVMATLATVALQDGRVVHLALKCAVTSGAVRRFLAGDPQQGLLDVLAGQSVERLGPLEEQTRAGEVLLDGPVVAALAAAGPVGTARPDAAGEGDVLALRGLGRTAAPAPWPDLPPAALAAEQIRPWLLPAVWDRLQHAQGTFLTELRPTVALFLRFSGIDYSRPTAGTRLDTYIRWVQSVLAGYEAALLQVTIGDKGSYFYVAFGAPVAHPDEAQRAVAAALELRSPPAQCSYIRGVQIGIASARAWTGAYGGTRRQTYGALGDGVNLAARLMQSAAPGGILVTQEVRAAAGPRFTWTSLPALTVKGKTAPVPVYGLVSESTGRALGLPEMRYGTPLVGRAAERATLEARLAAARSGQGQIVGITGEAGLGKSRLVAEAMHLARAAGFGVYGGAAQSYGTQTPYLAWQPIWRSLFDMDPDGTAAEQAQDLEDKLAARDPGWPDRMPLLGPVLGLTFPDTPLVAGMDANLRKTSAEALLAEYLRARTHGGLPLLIVLEDCHWLDPLSHDLLEAVGRAIAGVPVLLLLAYRPPELERIRAPRVATLAHFTELRLGAMTAEDARQIVQDHLDADHALPTGLIEEIIRRAEGNPFYLEELLDYMTGQGREAQKTQASVSLRWPVNLQSLLLARIDQLTERQRTVLKVASIIGRQFAVRQLWGVYPELGTAAEVAADLAVLDRMGFTLLDTPGDDPAYLFKHQVTQEVTYASLAHALRERLHEQFAAWLEADSARSGRPLPLDLLAYHYGRSTNLAKQCEYYRQAGDAAAATYANAAARDYYERLLKLLSNAERGPVLLALAELLERTGAWDDALGRYHEAQHLGAVLNDGQLVAQSELGAGSIRRHQGAYAGAREYLTQAQTHFQALQDRVGMNKALAELGHLYAMQGEYEPARAALEQALTLQQAVDDRAGIARTLYALGGLAVDQADYATARRLWEQSLAQRQDLGDKRGRAEGLNALGILLIQEGEFAEAVAVCVESLALFRSLGDQQGIVQAMLNLGAALHCQKDYLRAAALYAEGRTLAHTLGDQRFEAWFCLNLGEVAVDQGEYASAAGHYAAALTLWSALGNKNGIASALEGVAGAWGALGYGDYAAQLFGAGDALRESADAPRPASYREAYERLLNMAQQHSATGLWHACWETGHTMSLADALAFAATPPHTPVSIASPRTL